jgi:hypothetical protein
MISFFEFVNDYFNRFGYIFGRWHGYIVPAPPIVEISQGDYGFFFGHPFLGLVIAIHLL